MEGELNENFNFLSEKSLGNDLAQTPYISLLLYIIITKLQESMSKLSNPNPQNRSFPKGERCNILFLFLSTIIEERFTDADNVLENSAQCYFFQESLPASLFFVHILRNSQSQFIFLFKPPQLFKHRRRPYCYHSANSSL